MNEMWQEDDMYAKIVRQIANASIPFSPSREIVERDLTTRSTTNKSKSPIITAKVKQERMKNIKQQKAAILEGRTLFSAIKQRKESVEKVRRNY